VVLVRTLHSLVELQQVKVFYLAVTTTLLLVVEELEISSVALAQ
jgi:hypothetical protein